MIRLQRKDEMRMEVENDLAKALETISDEDMEKLDASCKKILSFKSVLSRLLKNCVDEFKDVSLKDIEEKYIVGTPEISKTPVHRDEVLKEKKAVADMNTERIEGTQNEDSTLKEGTAIFDIRFEAINPKITEEVITMLVNTESQGDFFPGYPLTKRAVYYCGRMLSAQYGTVFTNSHYEKVKRVISLWVCLNPPDYRKNTLNMYSLAEKRLVGNFKEKKDNYDLITVGMICLGDTEDDNCTGLIKMLSILLSAEMEVEDKKRRLHDEFDLAMTKEMEKEMISMCDYGQMVARKNLEKGVIKGVLDSLKNLMDTTGMNIEQAMNALKVPEKDRQMYISKMDQ